MFCGILQLIWWNRWNLWDTRTQEFFEVAYNGNPGRLWQSWKEFSLVYEFGDVASCFCNVRESMVRCCPLLAVRTVFCRSTWSDCSKCVLKRWSVAHLVMRSCWDVASKIMSCIFVYSGSEEVSWFCCVSRLYHCSASSTQRLFPLHCLHPMWFYSWEKFCSCTPVPPPGGVNSARVVWSYLYLHLIPHHHTQ